MTEPLTRRAFLAASASMAGGGLLRFGLPALGAALSAACSRRDAGAPLVYLDADLAAGLEAVAERILPRTATPGARDLGVIHFIDQAVGGFMAGERESLVAGMAALDAAGGGRFADLDPAAQDERLRAIEDEPFFATMYALTLFGAFAMPGYGGNRDYGGWRLLGFDHRHAWEPPFGAYDGDA